MHSVLEKTHLFQSVLPEQHPQQQTWAPFSWEYSMKVWVYILFFQTWMSIYANYSFG